MLLDPQLLQVFNRFKTRKGSFRRIVSQTKENWMENGNYFPDGKTKNELKNLLPSNKLFLQHVVESLDDGKRTLI